MPRLCSVCNSSSVQKINAQLASGAALSTVMSQTSQTEKLSVSALRRHAVNHLGGLREIGTDTAATTDLIDRLQQALADTDRVRASALAGGKGDLAIKAAHASARLIEILASRLGIDDLEIADLIKDGNLLARAIGRATRKNPAIGHAVAHELREINGDPDDIEALEALALSTEKKLQIEKKETA